MKPPPLARAALISAALVLASAPPLFAESQFRLDLRTDLVLGTGALGLFATSRLLPAREAPQRPESQINRLDAGLIAPYRPGVDTASTIAAYAALLLPSVAVLYEIGFPDRFVAYGVMYAEAFLLAYGTKDILKAAVSRHRPYTYREGAPAGEADEYADSLPSGHTTLAFLGASFLTATFGREYQQSPWRVPLSAGAFGLAGFVAVTRVVSGSHFVTDVAVGAAIGTLWGFLVPALHRWGPGESEDG